MDNFFKNQLYKWTYEKIKSNPKKFGGDFSNSLIMYEYLKEFNNETNKRDRRFKGAA